MAEKKLDENKKLGTEAKTECEILPPKNINCNRNGIFMENFEKKQKI